MNFSQKLNEYMEVLSCSAKELSQQSGISASSFSRYRNGERVPEFGSKSFEGLCETIASLAAQKNLSELTLASIKETFLSCDDFVSMDKEILRQNFNTLLSTLNININQLCQYMNYDPSAIFRIRNGTRKPGDANRFASSVASFVAREMQTPLEIALVAELIDCDTDEISDLSIRFSKIKSWLLKQPEQENEEDSVSKFLSKLDAFDLNEYIKVIKFDELKVPSVPFQIPSTKSYFGLNGLLGFAFICEELQVK